MCRYEEVCEGMNWYEKPWLGMRRYVEGMRKV